MNISFFDFDGKAIFNYKLTSLDCASNNVIKQKKPIKKKKQHSPVSTRDLSRVMLKSGAIYSTYFLYNDTHSNIHSQKSIESNVIKTQLSMNGGTNIKFVICPF